MSHDLITRREAILRVSALLGTTTFIGGSTLLTACEQRSGTGASGGTFSADDVALLDEIAETILPETKTPGAKAAKTGAFMALMVTDTYDEKDRKLFRDGMKSVDDETKKMHNVGFMAATAQQRLEVLEKLDREAKVAEDARKTAQMTPDSPHHYFRMMKELALLGYFTSEIGCTQALRYVESPGRYDPCVPYTAGEKAWASHA